MSGIIAAGAGLATTIADLFGEGPIVLGSVTFSGHEVPPQMRWGGGHSLITHKLPGGTRIVDAMGRDDATLEWSATFFSDDAAERAFEVDLMRIAGAPVPLIWGSHYYNVVIERFEPADQHQTIIPYRISCLVVSDMSQPPEQGLLSSILAVYQDINTAIGTILNVADFLFGPDVDLIYAAHLSIQDAMPSGLVLGAAASVRAINALEAAYDAVVAAQQTADTGIEAVALAAPAGSLVGSAADLAAVVASAGNSAQLVAAQAFVGRAVTNAEIGEA